MTWTLGIASSHESSACLYHDGRLVAAISEERLSRVKCDGYRLPQRAIDAGLALGGTGGTGGIGRRDIDHIALIYSFLPEKYVARESWYKELESRLARAKKRLRDREERQLNLNDVLKRLRGTDRPFMDLFRIRRFLADEGFNPRAQVHFFDHHATHAAAAAFYSGFRDAAVLTIDGKGDLDIHHTSGVYSEGRLAGLRVSDALGTSAGEFYEEITVQLGFRSLRHEGKVLGLAAYGDPKPLYPALQRALRLSPDGRHPDSDFAGVTEAFRKRRAFITEAGRGHSRENVAAAAQAVFEEALVELTRNLVRETGKRHLALNGGVFANVKLNQRIAALSEVDAIFVFPAMSDTGNSLGAALLLQEELEPGFFGREARALEHVYLGPEASAAEIERELSRAGLALAYGKIDTETLVERAAEAIHAGGVVGWFQGRMEFGPRALGNRSMLARPIDPSINKWLNQRLERTEFMPFAPSALDSAAETLFANYRKSRYTAKFMTITYDVASEWAKRVPAVVHLDGTARPQIVSETQNPRYYRVLKEYEKRTGLPLFVNTSFNMHEEPIVCTPQDAIGSFLQNMVDVLAIGNYEVQRGGP